MVCQLLLGGTRFCSQDAHFINNLPTIKTIKSWPQTASIVAIENTIPIGLL